MDHDSLAAFKGVEHFARHVSAVMEAVATLMDPPDAETLDFQRVPEMFAGCPQCTIEALLYLAVVMFNTARWDAARVRAQIPTMVARALSCEIV